MRPLAQVVQGGDLLGRVGAHLLAKAVLLARVKRQEVGGPEQQPRRPLLSVTSNGHVLMIVAAPAAASVRRCGLLPKQGSGSAAATPTSNSERSAAAREVCLLAF